jgi:hypothetical protein
MARKHTVDEVLKALSQKHDVRVNLYTHEIEVLTGKKVPVQNDLGNKSWGKIDYLCNHCGYILFRVHEFSKN